MLYPTIIRLQLRVHPHDSVSQNLNLEKNKSTLSLVAWIQVSKGRIPVSAVSRLKQGTYLLVLFLLSPVAGPCLKVALLLMLQALLNSISRVTIHRLTYGWIASHCNPSPKSNGCLIKIKPLKRPERLSGIAQNPRRAKWTTQSLTPCFSSPRRTCTSPRPQCVLDDPKYQQGWINSLCPTDLSKATTDRINSVMSRYRGEVIGWDVVNENLHFNFFESKLGQNASAVFYNLAQKIDGTSTLFLNEYNTIENARDSDSTPAKYLQKLRDIKAFPGNGNLKLGIGLESHFSSAAPNLAYMRASIDTLAATNFPIWLTEVDVQRGPYQAQYLEQILREAHSHPKVAGIVIWSAWKPQGCYTMCLTDNNFKNLPTGNVVDELLAGRIAIKSSAGRTDGNGFFEASLSHGLYSVKIHHPSAKNSSLVQKLNVVSSTGADNQTLLMRFAA
ncbi:hypothetical protein GH714_010883 [Hevea brasiliensis]|uniref:GH10 domain-containing protein n=1 Tax=Hevea brasiliensis TaxID=3981 RepID=A0A6A6L2P9_HEVBR|nr:hypothetical protein GH714_010883 [Hevea brasiliensis]